MQTRRAVLYDTVEIGRIYARSAKERFATTWEEAR